MDQNDLDGAIRAYTTAIELAPALVDAYIKRGIALRTNGDPNGAIDHFEAMEKIDPNAAAGHPFIAESYNNRATSRWVNFRLSEPSQVSAKRLNALLLQGKESRRNASQVPGNR
ncbi:MAG TPA: tetratricopeptide repeat protein [Pyrinomonadaceae bacterium]|nr:tetratricopeptide repeat protein [Pyrinomonadaceae bacterium]